MATVANSGSITQPNDFQCIRRPSQQIAMLETNQRHQHMNVRGACHPISLPRALVGLTATYDFVEHCLRMGQLRKLIISAVLCRSAENDDGHHRDTSGLIEAPDL